MKVNLIVLFSLAEGQGVGRGEINNSVVKLNLFQKGWRKVRRERERGLLSFAPLYLTFLWNGLYFVGTNLC